MSSSCDVVIFAEIDYFRTLVKPTSTYPEQLQLRVTSSVGCIRLLALHLHNEVHLYTIIYVCVYKVRDILYMFNQNLLLYIHICFEKCLYYI